MELQDTTLSTTIDTDPSPSAAGGGVPKIVDDTKLPSLRDDIEAAFKEDDVKADAAEEKAEEKVEPKEAKEEPKADEKADDKPEQEAKPEAKEDAEPKADEKAEEKPEAEQRHRAPPKNFLPDAVEHWKNTPRSVRRDIEVMERTHEEEIGRYREAGQRYESIKPFDDLARENGLDLRESLTRIHELENLMQTQPLMGLNRILMEAGPRKNDGQPMSLFEVASFIVSQGQEGYQKLMQMPQSNGHAVNPQIAQMQEKIDRLEAQAKASEMNPIVERFASRNARFSELQDDVAFFLQSGRISASLSPEERLAAAYDMAVRINPDSTVGKVSPSTEGEAARRADEDFSGSKSIKSSLGSVTEEVEDNAKAGESVRDSILREMRRQKP